MPADVPQTTLDRFIGYLSPERGVSRMRARTTMEMASGGGYKSARRDRRQTKRWNAGQGSADADQLPDIPDLRGRSRDLSRNNPLATGATNTQVLHTIGTGLVPHPMLDREVLGLTKEQAAEWERACDREWRLATKCIDLEESMTFDAFQELAFRSALDSGDTLVIKRFRDRAGTPYGLRLQLVEADRISNPHRRGDGDDLKGGVQIDKDGRDVAYHVSNKHPGDRSVAKMTWEKVPARFKNGRRICLHVVDKLRPGQTRGVPFLAPVIEILKQLEKFTDAELDAAVVAALFAVFIEHENEGGTTIVDTIPKEKDGSGDLSLKSGAILDLAPGEKANVANPGRPNPQFDPFVQSLIRQIGVALNLPYELLIKHFTASYSASRAALEIAYQGFMRMRAWFVRTLCNPVREMVIEEAVARGRLIAPGFFDDPIKREAWLGCQWIGPARLSLDPFKDARADTIDMASGAKTLEEVCTQRTGGDWERKTEQRATEVEKRKGLGLGEPSGVAIDGTPNAPPAKSDDGDPPSDSDKDDSDEDDDDA